MKNIELKNMSTKERRNYLLKTLQAKANFVLWSIRDNDSDIMKNIKNYKDTYRIYRNIKSMSGEKIYNSPRIDLQIIGLNWYL